MSLPDTTETRTINVKLKRKLPTEKVEHFGHEDDEAFYILRRKAARWAGDNARALKQARPALPDGFDNRLADNWRVLLAIADLAGGRYPATARATAVRLSRQPELGEEIRLLSALREMFVAQAEVTSAEVVAHLTADPASEWYAFHDRGPITQRQVAFLLRGAGRAAPDQAEDSVAARL